MVPDTDAEIITNAFIQIRRIEAEESGLITDATLVHNKLLPLDANSYAIDEIFSNSNIPGLPEGLEMGRKYEIAVILESRDENGMLKGRARTFFEFMPLTDDMGDVAVFLPSVGPDGVFRFDVKVSEGETIIIDPVVAIGYDYQIGEGNPLFASVTLPMVGDGLFELWLFDHDLLDYVFEAELTAGIEYFFADDGVDRFRVLGIEPSAGLDPTDVRAFATALTFAGDGRFTGSMTPITQVVSEPSVLTLIGLALAGMAAAGCWTAGRMPPGVARSLPDTRGSIISYMHLSFFMKKRAPKRPFSIQIVRGRSERVADAHQEGIAVLAQIDRVAGAIYTSRREREVLLRIVAHTLIRRVQSRALGQAVRVAQRPGLGVLAVCIGGEAAVLHAHGTRFADRNLCADLPDLVGIADKVVADDIFQTGVGTAQLDGTEVIGSAEHPFLGVGTRPVVGTVIYGADTDRAIRVVDTETTLRAAATAAARGGSGIRSLVLAEAVDRVEGQTVEVRRLVVDGVVPARK